MLITSGRWYWNSYLQRVVAYAQEDEDKFVRRIMENKMALQSTELTPALLREFVEKIVVHAPDKSNGHRVQRIDVHYNFIGEIDSSPEFNRYSKKTTA